MKYKLEGLNELSKQFHKFQIDKGFTDSNVSQRLMLISSEISEFFEAYRKDKLALLEVFEKNYNGKNLIMCFEHYIKDSQEDEAADILIRLLAFIAERGIDIERHVELKMKYNETRGFKYGGKKF